MLNLISKEIIGLLLKYSKKEPDKDDKEIFIYGLECFLNTSIVVIILILWGILVHQFFETILWIIVFALTRHYSGGLHAPSEFSCIFISVCLGITNHFFITHFNVSQHGFLFCILTCILFTPINTSKVELTVPLKMIYKLISISIIIILNILCIYIGDNSLSASIMYALICVYTLILIHIVLQLVIKNRIQCS